MTFEDVAKWVKDEVESLADAVHPEIGDRRDTPVGGEYEEWAIGVASEDPADLRNRAWVLVNSIRQHYGQDLELLLPPFSYSQVISYPPAKKAWTLYWRTMPEAGVVKAGTSQIYARFTFR